MSSSIPFITKKDLLIAHNYAPDIQMYGDFRGLNASELYRIDQDDLLSPFSENEIPELDISSMLESVDDWTFEQIDFEPLELYSTNQQDINRINNEFLEHLRNRQESFCVLLRRTDFEDGYDNEAIEEVEEYMRQNKSATIIWLHELYAENQKDSIIVAGLLRIIGSVVSKEDIKSFITLIKCGLNDAEEACQEAALMAIEVARTKECVDAIETTSFSSRIIQRYAEKVKNSIKKELGLCF